MAKSFNESQIGYLIKKFDMISQNKSKKSLYSMMSPTLSNINIWKAKKQKEQSPILLIDNRQP